jgi:two-component system response regulator FixJ
MRTDATVFLVDDDTAVRQSICWMLRKVGLKVEAYESARAMLERYDASRPGCLVLDLRLPGMSGLELRQKLLERGCQHPFLIISGHGEVPDAVEAMQQGAIDFIEKPYRRQQLLARVLQAIDRDAENRQAGNERGDVEQRLTTLSNREREVLQLLMQSKSSKEIAEALNLSVKTIEVHRSNLARKMNTSSMSELVVKLVRLQMDIPPRKRARKNKPPKA